MDRRHFLTGSVAAAIALASARRHACAAVFGASKIVGADINALSGDGTELTLR